MFKDICLVDKEHHKTNYVRNIDRSLLGWVGNGEPYGAWSKGALTTTLCQFIEHLCTLLNLESCGDERLSLIATLATKRSCIGFCDC